MTAHCDSLHFSLDKKQQPEVLHFLNELDTQELLELGGELGLDPIKLNRIPSQELPRRISISWIQEQDHVKETSGTPTWRSLAKAMRQVGANGTADKIEQHCQNNM